METKDIVFAIIMVIGFAAVIWSMIRIGKRAEKLSNDITIQALHKTLQGTYLNFQPEDVITRNTLIEILTSIQNTVVPNMKELRRQEMMDYELSMNEVVLRYDADDLPAGTKGSVGTSLRTERGVYLRIFIPIEGTVCRNAYYLIDVDNMEIIEQPNLA